MTHVDTWVSDGGIGLVPLLVTDCAHLQGESDGARSEVLDALSERVATCHVPPDQADGLMLIPKTASCTMTGFNPTICTATCTGTCCFGTVSCSRDWDLVVWGVDKVVGAPCPGYVCDCP